MRIIHLTDPHLTTLPSFAAGRFLFNKRFLGAMSWSRRQKYHLRSQLDLLVKDIRLEAPDLLICTGDLVQIGTEAEIIQAKDWLDELASICRVILVPGNHDYYQRESYQLIERYWSPYFFQERHKDQGFPSIFQHQGITFIGLCSAQAEPFWSARGMLGGEQLEKLKSILETSSDTFQCIFLHHPPVPGMCAKRKSLRDAILLSHLLKEQNVQMVLHGHVHQNQIYTANERTKVFATASASNVAGHAPASYRLFEIKAGGRDWEVLASLKVFGSSITKELTRHSW